MASVCLLLPVLTRGLEPAPISLCALVSNQEAYINRTLTIRARIFHGVRGSWLVPSEACEQQQAASVRLGSVSPGEWPPEAGRRGYSGPFILEGRLYISNRHIPQTKKDSPPLELDAVRIRVAPDSR